MFQLTEQDQRLLLRIARDSVQFCLLKEAPYLPEVPGGLLTEPRGVFVSIHKRGELRGCIGNVHPAGALYRNAAEWAVAAAVGELRCVFITLVEMAVVDLRVTALLLMRQVDDIDDIEFD